MDNLIREELYRMKYLFSHERGRVVSEQKDEYLLKEAIGELPKDQAEADKFKVWLKQNQPNFKCRVGKSKGMSISAAPNRPYTGPCFRDAWKTYGESFVNPTAQNQNQTGNTTPISEPDVASDEKNEPVNTSSTPTNQGATNQGATNQGDTNQGATNQGATNQGATNQGATNQGATNQGATNQGATNQGATNQGATNQGATNQGATNQGADTGPEESSTEK